MVVGLTGGIGSGKSTVANFFKELGAVVFIADSEAKKIMHNSKNIRKQIIKIFGEEAYIDKNLNRSYIAEIVFKQKDKLNQLNEIVHPAVRESFNSFVQANQGEIILYENAILFESNSHKMCDKIIVVSAPLEVRIERVVKRDNTTREAVSERINNQLPQAEKEKLADFVINNTELEDTKNQVQELFGKLKSSQFKNLNN